MYEIFLSQGISMMSEMQQQYNTRLGDLRNRWRESKTMPRKKKKQVRKEINLDHMINEYGKTLFTI